MKNGIREQLLTRLTMRPINKARLPLCSQNSGSLLECSVGWVRAGRRARIPSPMTIKIAISQLLLEDQVHVRAP
jgi:hypothetical protein